MATKKIDMLMVDIFKTEVHDRAKQVDPSEEQDWYSLTLGWALAKGMDPDEANEFAMYIRYNTNLG